MRFQVPQFIDIEDKIFGPLTFKQFLYLVGGAGLSFILYRLIPFPFSILLILPVAGLSISLAFIKINNKPFIEIIQSYVMYISASKTYIWKRRNKIPNKKPKEEVNKEMESKKRKLKDIAWGLDVLDVDKEK